jgi:predicted amidophosphoribosyltransferase
MLGINQKMICNYCKAKIDTTPCSGCGSTEEETHVIRGDPPPEHWAMVTKEEIRESAKY